MWRGDARLSGASDSKLALPLQRKWQYLAEDSFAGTPVGGGGRIYAATEKGWIIALETNGKEAWKVQLISSSDTGEKVGAALSGPLAVSKDVLVACSVDGKVYGLSLKDGGVKWIYSAGGVIQGAPIVAGQRVIVLSKDQGQIHCIDSGDGSRIWLSKPEARADGHPALVKGSVVFGNCNAMLLFLELKTGKLSHAVEFGEGHEIAGAPSCATGLIYVGTRAGSLMCVDEAKKTHLWEKELGGGELFTPLATTGSQVVAATGDRKLICFSGGIRKWEYNSNGLLGAPVIAGSLVLAVADEELVVLDAEDGAKVGSVECPPTQHAPALVDDLVIVAGEDSSIYAFGK